MAIDANGLFEEELKRRGLPFVRASDDEYRLQVSGTDVTASLANVRRNAERDGDPGLVTRFVDRILAAFTSGARKWPHARDHLLFSAGRSDHEFGDALRTGVSDEVVRVLTLTDADHSIVTWVTPAMCSDWGVTVEEANAAALTNQDRLLEGLGLEITHSGGRKLGMVPLDSPYKASVIFAPAFKKLVEPVLGWPVLVVIPCRDFIYVVEEASPLIERMGGVVVDEFRASGYAITTEVLEVSDDGIAAIGRYPA